MFEPGAERDGAGSKNLAARLSRMVRDHLLWQESGIYKRVRDIKVMLKMRD